MVAVNVFVGTQLQGSYDLDVESDTTYQDIISTLILANYPSGSIQGVEGEHFDMDSTVMVDEINYVILAEPDTFVFIRTLEGLVERVPISPANTIQDVYNHVQAHDWGKNVRLVLEDPGLTERGYPLPGPGFPLRFAVSQPMSRASKSARPLIVPGRSFSMDTPLGTLNLQPDTTFHLVKYHVAQAC